MANASRSTSALASRSCCCTRSCARRTSGERRAAAGRHRPIRGVRTDDAGSQRRPPSPPLLLHTEVLVDDIERRMDQLGWQTAHIVGNSLGGWVGVRAGTARAGPHADRDRAGRRLAAALGVQVRDRAEVHRWAPALIAAGCWARAGIELPFARRLATLPVSGTRGRPGRRGPARIIEDVTHCRAYLQLLIKTLRMPGLLELAEPGAPTQLVVCEKDRVFPASARPPLLPQAPARRALAVIRLDGVGHIPMLEAPAAITDLIRDFVDEPRRRAAARRLILRCRVDRSARRLESARSANPVAPGLGLVRYSSFRS